MPSNASTTTGDSRTHFPIHFTSTGENESRFLTKLREMKYSYTYHLKRLDNQQAHDGTTLFGFKLEIWPTHLNHKAQETVWGNRLPQALLARDDVFVAGYNYLCKVPPGRRVDLQLEREIQEGEEKLMDEYYRVITSKGVLTTPAPVTATTREVFNPDRVDDRTVGRSCFEESGNVEQSKQVDHVQQQRRSPPTTENKDQCSSKSVVGAGTAPRAEETQRANQMSGAERLFYATKAIPTPNPGLITNQAQATALQPTGKPAPKASLSISTPKPLTQKVGEEPFRISIPRGEEPSIILEARYKRRNKFYAGSRGSWGK